MMIRVLLISMLISCTNSGLLSTPACITLCNIAAAACYTAAGLVIGTVTLGAGAPPAAIACSAGQGVCMTGCLGTAISPL